MSHPISASKNLPPAAQPWATEIENRLRAAEDANRVTANASNRINNSFAPQLAQVSSLVDTVSNAVSTASTATEIASDANVWETRRPVSPRDDGSSVDFDLPKNAASTWYVVKPGTDEILEVWRWRPPTGEVLDQSTGARDLAGEWYQQKWGTDTLGEGAVDLSNLAASVSGDLTAATQAVQDLKKRADDTAAQYAEDQVTFKDALADLQALAGSKGRVIVSSTQPSGADNVEGNLWINTKDGGSAAYRYDGASNTWVAVESEVAIAAAAAVTKAQADAAKALSQSQDAQDKATAAELAAANAQSSANGKNSIFYTPSKPTLTGRIAGDLWFDTDDNYKSYVYDVEKQDFVNLPIAADTSELDERLDAVESGLAGQVRAVTSAITTVQSSVVHSQYPPDTGVVGKSVWVAPDGRMFMLTAAGK